jgi:hypothetical protein
MTWCTTIFDCKMQNLRIKSYYWLCKYSKFSGELWRGVLCMNEDKSSVSRCLDSRLERYVQMAIQRDRRLKRVEGSNSADSNLCHNT